MNTKKAQEAFGIFATLVALLVAFMVGFRNGSVEFEVDPSMISAAREFMDSEEVKSFLKELDTDHLVTDAQLSNIVHSANAKLEVQKQVADLTTTIHGLETDLAQKKRMLSGLELSVEKQTQKLALLKLNPQQLATLEKYNKTINRDPTFREWVAAHQTWWGIASDIIIGVLMLFVGIAFEHLRAERKRRKADANRPVLWTPPGIAD